MTIVTVSAAYGAGGSEVGPRLAERLGVPFLDRAIPSEVAERLAIPLDEAARATSRSAGCSRGWRCGSRRWARPSAPTTTPRTRSTRRPSGARRRTIIREHAASGDLVVLGPGRRARAARRPARVARAPRRPARPPASSRRVRLGGGERAADRERARTRPTAPARPTCATSTAPMRAIRALPPDDRLDRAAARGGRGDDRARRSEPDRVGSRDGAPPRRPARAPAVAPAAQADTIVFRRGADVWRWRRTAPASASLTAARLRVAVGGRRRHDRRPDTTGWLHRLTPPGADRRRSRRPRRHRGPPAETPTHVRISPDGADRLRRGDRGDVTTRDGADARSPPAARRARRAVVDRQRPAAAEPRRLRRRASGTAFCTVRAGAAVAPVVQRPGPAWATGFDAAASRDGSRAGGRRRRFRWTTPQARTTRGVLSGGPGSAASSGSRPPTRRDSAPACAGRASVAWAESDGIHVCRRPLRGAGRDAAGRVGAVLVARVSEPLRGGRHAVERRARAARRARRGTTVRVECAVAVSVRRGGAVAVVRPRYTAVRSGAGTPRASGCRAATRHVVATCPTL